MKRIIGAFLSLSLTSCAFSRLDIQTQYLGEQNLASYHVGTPDPQLAHPPTGQRLMVQWSLSSKELENDNTELYLKIRFRNRKEHEIHYPIHQKQGTYCYDLVGQDYLDSGGVLTYKGEIWANGSLLISWKHPLWIELITFEGNPGH